MMKTKRSGYLQKNKSVTKKKLLAAAAVGSIQEVEHEKKEQDCTEGVCAIVWKPMAAAR